MPLKIYKIFLYIRLFDIERKSEQPHRLWELSFFAAVNSFPYVI